MSTTTIDEVLDFWFGEPTSDEAESMAKVRRWFMGGPEVDQELRARFGAAVEAALAGELDAWAETARGRLALVLLLDQLTRNCYRGDPRTYAGDAKARALVLDAFARGLDRELGFAERVFLSMPLLHSEELTHHERLAELSPSLTDAPPPGWSQFAAANREQTVKYLDIIRRFGRFPHRNELLGRASSPEEEVFLADWAERARPKSVG